MRIRRLPTELKKTLEELSIAAYMKALDIIIVARRNNSTDTNGGEE